jgi:hypothetical protein
MGCQLALHAGPGQTDYVYVIDVDGERVVITLVGYPDWSGTYLESLQAMMNSLEFFEAVTTQTRVGGQEFASVSWLHTV